jgi:succinyl-CoA synthetase alpha subunit
MAILVDERSKIVIQGITGQTGRTFAARMAAAGTPLAAGVTPGKSGTTVEERPVFDTCHEAAAATGANVSLVVVPPLRVRDAVLEAIDAGLGVITVYSEGVPAHDGAEIIEAAAAAGAVILGPNSAGVASPGKANLSDIDESLLEPGTVACVSRSGTLAYELLLGLRERALGVSSVVCLGGDPLVGLTYKDTVELLHDDEETSCIVLLGEIGGIAELEAAERWRELGATTPLIAHVVGVTAPRKRRMGHAGAIVAHDEERALQKMARLEAGGVTVADRFLDLPALVDACLRVDRPTGG